MQEVILGRCDVSESVPLSPSHWPGDAGGGVREEGAVRVAVPIHYSRGAREMRQGYLQTQVARAQKRNCRTTERFHGIAEYKRKQKDTILHVMHLVFVRHRSCNSPSDVGRHGMVVGHPTHLWRPQVHWRTASIELIRRNLLLLYAIRRPPREATHHPRVVLRHIGRLHLPVHLSKVLLVGVGML